MYHDLPRFAVAQSLPSQTTFAADGALLGYNGQSPKPTQQSVPPIELFRRQGDRPHTCGFHDGERASPLTCAGTLVCATDEAVGFGACCDPDRLEACPIGTLCKNNDDSCGGGCEDDVSVFKCGVDNDFTCASALYDFGSTVITYLFCTDGDDKSAVAIVDEDEPGPTVFAVPVGPNTSTSESETSESETSESQPSESQPSELEPSELESNESESSVEGSGSDGDDAGIIAGSVIGGLVVITGLVFGILYLLLRHRRRKNSRDANPHKAVPASHVETRQVKAELPGENSDNVPVEMQSDNSPTLRGSTRPLYQQKLVEAP